MLQIVYNNQTLQDADGWHSNEKGWTIINESGIKVGHVWRCVGDTLEEKERLEREIAKDGK